MFGAAIFFGKNGASSFLVWEISGGGKLLAPLIIISALVDSINPCAFSILLLTIAFLFSIGQLRSRALQIGGFYILGIFLVYLLIGLGILQALHLFNTPHFMGKIGALLLVILGLINIINEYFPSFPIKLKIPQAAHHKIAELVEKVSLPAAFLVGALVGLCEFPCTGGPYLTALGLLHDKTSYMAGAGYLLLYNLIFILPLVIILFIASDKNLLEKVKAWQQKERMTERLGIGLAMIIMGIIIYFI